MPYTSTKINFLDNDFICLVTFYTFLDFLLLSISHTLCTETKGFAMISLSQPQAGGLFKDVFLLLFFC